MKKKYTLTISILASNRKDTFPKTLESIKPILDNVSSELIIVDTGCDEEMLAFIRKYTDKIVKFQWCNDFSKARNAGLERSQGEWFMFLDDDEWFDDVSELISFFNSDEKNKYGYGRYIVRNYRNLQGSEWSNFYAGRIFKLNKGTKFVDIIHERPIEVSGPVKQFSAFVHHYGYAHQTEESRLAHRERNLALLHAQVEASPTLARHFVHLVQEYCSAKDYAKAFELAEWGINSADMSDINNLKDVPGLYAVRVWALENQSRWKEVLECAGTYLSSRYCNKLCEATLCGMCATAACNLGRYEECIEYAKRFFDIADILRKDVDKVSSMSTIILVYALDEENYVRIKKVALKAVFLMKDIATFLKLSGGVSADERIRQIPLARWMVKIDEWSAGAKVKELIETKQAFDVMCEADHLHKRYFDMVFEEALCYRRKIDGITVEEARTELSEYARNVISFYKDIYIIEHNMKMYSSILPNRCQGALLLREICDENAGGDEEKIQYIQALLPQLKNILKKI